MAVVEKKRELKDVSYFGPEALRWLAANGVDFRAAFSGAKMHEEMAQGFEKALRRKSLKLCGKEMDGYLAEFRSAENQLRKLTSFLSDPEFKRKFLSANKDYSDSKYDSIIANIKKKASYCQNAAWAYEKVYADKYGPRQEYQTHLFVREVARQLREEMEKAAGKPSGQPAYKKAQGGPAFAQKARTEPVSRETHALVSRFMQDLQGKYEKKIQEKGGEEIAREEHSGYRRGYERAGGMKYINVAARESAREGREESRYHRGERRMRPSEPVMLARRSVPVKKEEELSAGEARVVPVKGPSSVAQAQAEVDRVKKQRSALKKEISSLSGSEKKEAAEQMAKLNKELFRLRRIRDSFMGA